MTQIKQVIELPTEDFQQLKETSQKILSALQSLKQLILADSYSANESKI